MSDLTRQEKDAARFSKPSHVSCKSAIAYISVSCLRLLLLPIAAWLITAACSHAQALTTGTTSMQPASSLTTLDPAGPSDLGVLVNGSFVYGNSSLINDADPTIVISHGWDSSPSAFLSFAETLQSANSNVNILVWNWSEAADSGLNLGGAAAYAPYEGQALGTALASDLGDTYNKPVQFIGHSLGTIVNAQAIQTLHTDDSSLTAANTQDTLFDDAGVVASWLNTIPVGGTNAALTIDNYISAVGQIHSQATNVVLDQPAGMSYVAFHSYPISWYANTVDNSGAPSQVGYNISITTGSSPGNISNLYYEGATNETVTSISGSAASAIVAERDAAELASGASPVDTTPVGSLTAALVTGTIEISGSVNVSLGAGQTPVIQLVKYAPAYAWLPIAIPTDAKDMQFNFEFSNLSSGDWLSLGIGSTSLFALQDEFAVDGQQDTSTPIDVSQWAGQDVNLFLGLIPADGDNDGGSVTVSDISFQGVPEPSTWMLLTASMIGLTLLRRSRKAILNPHMAD
jgi:pimeloyl-ACP methyl ester carboxylesterase